MCERRGARPLTAFAARGLSLLLLLWVAGCGDDAQEEADGSAALDSALEAASTAGPWNVVLITLDTARADAFGAYGQKLPTSPNIDRMAREGVLFEQAIAAQPNTLPSHATILTGKQPYAHGVRANAGYKLGEEQVTLAEVLKQRGYVTAAEIAAPVIGRRTQLDQGFDVYRDTEAFDVRMKQVLIQRANGQLDRIEAHDRDGSDITAKAVAFLGAHRFKPFFLWLHYFDPHAFYQPPARFLSRFVDSPYHGEIHYSDHQVGEVVAALRRLGLAERTLVIVTSDHGEGLNEHDERTHSFYIYESTLRVPLIFWGPKSLPAGKRIESLVRSADIAPTVLDLLGAPPLEDVQGVSLLPLIDGSKQDLGLPAYGESAEPLALFGSSLLRSFRRAGWKYIHKLEPELYDLAADPNELDNLAERHPQRVERLRAEMERLVARDATADAARVELSQEEIAQLQELGYVGAVAPEGFNDREDLVDLHGPDPVAMNADLKSYANAYGHFRNKNYNQAEHIFRELIGRHPDSRVIRDGLLATLASAKRWDAVLPVAEEIMRRAPDESRPILVVARAHMELRNFEASEKLLRLAIERFPCDRAERRLAGLFHVQGREAERFEVLEAAISRCPASHDIKNDFAYLMLTTPDAKLRNGARAMALARAAVEAAKESRPDYLDTLACAQAEIGNFEGAVLTASRAIELLRNRDYPDEVVAEVSHHRDLFREGKRVNDTL